MDKKTILIAGGSGLIGNRLTEYLSSDNYNFHILTRSKKPDRKNIKFFEWNTGEKTMDFAAFEGVDTVINLAGAGIADKRWTAERKKIILDSRLDSIHTLEKAIKDAKLKLNLYIGASAVGYYGDQGDKLLTEKDLPGTGFLAEVTEKWESETRRLGELFTRQTTMRIGIVLSSQGGALKEILKPAALGSYGYFGDGKAYYSWIHIDDICKIMEQHIADDSYSGIYNATAPAPITIKQLVKAVKAAKGGFGIVMPVPVIALKLVLGEMTQMLTDSMRVLPKRLIAEGFEWQFTDPTLAVKNILEKKV